MKLGPLLAVRLYAPTALGLIVDIALYSLQVHHSWLGEPIFVCGFEAVSLYFLN